MSGYEQLIKCCIAGERAAQQALYNRLAGKLYAICLRYCRHVPDAQDTLQEGFMKIFTYLPDFKHTGSFEGWCKRIIVRTAIEKLKQKAQPTSFSHLEPEANYEIPIPEEVLSKISTDELTVLIQEMPDGYRAVFNLFAIEGYSHNEIAQMLNISESTSKSQYHRARFWLLSRLFHLQKTPEYAS